VSRKRHSFLTPLLLFVQGYGEKGMILAFRACTARFCRT
jgi:hypothetical protein